MMILVPAMVAIATGTVELRLSINDAPLADIPFVDNTHQWPPKLSWVIQADHTEFDLHQVAYVVQVDGAEVGRLASGAMQHTIPAPMRSDALYAVNVSVILADNRTITKSGHFRTALLDGFGQASWIGGGTLLQRQLPNFADKSKVSQATVYASGVGCFSIKLGGKPISSSYMDPGWGTLPTVRVTYRAFDVTPYFSSSSPPKTLRVALGMCKYGYQNSFCVGGHAANGACKAFLFTLRITFQDGTVQTVNSSSTDNLWKVTTSANPIRYSHLYHGEQYDGRVMDTPTQWQPATPAKFNTGESGTQPVDAANALGTPVLLTMPPLSASRTYTPISIKQIASKPVTKWVFDMGDNMAGFARLSVPRSALEPGVPVTLKYAEVLKGDGSVAMAWCNGEGPACHCGGINCANQTDTFIPKPASTNSYTDDVVTYTPSFTYHGFRYVQVEGLASGYSPTPADLTALFVHSAVKRNGNVSFANPVLDGVQKAIVQTQLSNLHFHPTDCPQREKRGWTGDAAFTSRQASLNLDMRQLYGNWLQTMQDHDTAGCALAGVAPVFPQTNKDICCNPKHRSFGCDYTGIPNGTFSRTGGSVADVVPFMYVGGWPGDPSWGSISSVLPFTVWKAGYDSLVETYYDGAKRNVDFFLREAGQDGLIEFGYYGDWLSIDRIDKPQVTATSQIRVTAHLVEMAQHLGKHDDVQTYNATLHRLRTAYHTKYWDAKAKSYHGGTQTANLMPIVLDIPPPAEREMAASAFLTSVQRAGNATSSGLVGASFVLQALVAAGRGDIALSMAMREEKPSWGYMVKQGPGTIWETWDDTSNSHNHPMFTASIGPYLYTIAGVDPSTWTVGSFLRRRNNAALASHLVDRSQITMHITPDPHAVRVLGRASAWVGTTCGEVSVSWAARDTRFEMNATVPHNCGHARLQLHIPETKTPADARSGLCVGEYHLDQNEAEQNEFPRNVFGVYEAPDGRSVHVLVGGGRSELQLRHCLG